MCLLKIQLDYVLQSVYLLLYKPKAISNLKNTFSFFAKSLSRPSNKQQNKRFNLNYEKRIYSHTQAAQYYCVAGVLENIWKQSNINSFPPFSSACLCFSFMYLHQAELVETKTFQWTTTTAFWSFTYNFFLLRF